MTDRRSRDRFAQLICHLAAGLITTDRFEAAIPLDSDDIAIWEIWQATISPGYHDLWPYRLRGRHRLDTPHRSLMVRCIAFLYSVDQYAWPPLPDADRDWSDWESLIDWDVWPFATRSALQAARRQPRLLVGTTTP